METTHHLYGLRTATPAKRFDRAGSVVLPARTELHIVEFDTVVSALDTATRDEYIIDRATFWAGNPARH